MYSKVGVLPVAGTVSLLLLGCGQQQGGAPAPAPVTQATPATQATPTTEAAPAPEASPPAEAPAVEAPIQAAPEKLAAEHLPNPWRVHPKVISGGLPEGDAAFKELADLGVKTVISVDGAKPDVETAKKYGLRYVHLPHSYDGVPEQRAKELAKAVRDLPGQVYIHCHHGKHRSPAATAVACVGAGLISSDSAVAVLKAAGTSENYRGLYQSAESAKQLDVALLDELKAEFPETAKIPPIADAMIEIEHAHDHLKALAANNWQPLKDQPALEPAHQALLLREHYTELARTEDTQKQSEDFRKLLAESEATALELEMLLNDWKKAGSPDPAPETISKAFAAATKSCATCHKAHRDVPLGEKGK